MIRILLSLLCLFSFNSALSFQGFIEIEPGRSLYVDWNKPQNGKPTLILLNGLTYSTKYWRPFALELIKQGYGVLRYDPIGMGETLLKYAPIRSVIRIEDQARDLDLLTKKLGLTEKLNLLGLSYGGGLAIAFAQKYPKRIQNAILVAPYTEPLAAQDEMIRKEIDWFRKTYPSNPATNEELYSYFLRQNVYYVYPRTEPSMLENIFKPEAVFQMTEGIRQYNILEASQSFPSRSVHLILAGQDQYIPKETLNKFWEQLPVAAKASRVTLLFSEHKVPEAFPIYFSKLTKELLSDPKFLEGKTFTANPYTGRLVQE